MEQLRFAELDDGTTPGTAMLVRSGDQPDDPAGVGFGLSRLPSADEALIDRWLLRKSPRTRRMYLATMRRFFATIAKEGLHKARFASSARQVTGYRGR